MVRFCFILVLLFLRNKCFLLSHWGGTWITISNIAHIAHIGLVKQRCMAFFSLDWCTLLLAAMYHIHIYIYYVYIRDRGPRNKLAKYYIYRPKRFLNLIRPRQHINIILQTCVHTFTSNNYSNHLFIKFTQFYCDCKQIYKYAAKCLILWGMNLPVKSTPWRGNSVPTSRSNTLTLYSLLNIILYNFFNCCCCCFSANVQRTAARAKIKPSKRERERERNNTVPLTICDVYFCPCVSVWCMPLRLFLFWKSNNIDGQARNDKKINDTEPKKNHIEN